MRATYYDQDRQIVKGRTPAKRKPYVIDGVGNVPLTQGKIAICDPNDVEWLGQWNWFASYNRKKKCWRAMRARRAYEGSKGSLHMSRELLKASGSIMVDHINHDTLDNRRSNLRICTSTENNRNVRSKGKSSKFKGVYWDRVNKKWAAVITCGKTMKIGLLDEEEDAAIMYNVAAQLFFGKFAYLNSV